MQLSSLKNMKCAVRQVMRSLPAAVVCGLMQAHSDGRATLTKDQIIRWAGSHLHIALEDGAAGYSKWSNVSNMETKNWVRRTAYSRYVCMWLCSVLVVDTTQCHLEVSMLMC
jgi:hypothetical protein